MKRKVSLKWLAYSNDPLAVEYRRKIAGSRDCVLCCCFFEDNYDDGEGNMSKCKFEEIDGSEIEHFQQMADLTKIDVQIVSLEDEKETQKERVEFT